MIDSGELEIDLESLCIPNQVSIAVLGCVSTGTYEPEGVTPTRAFDRTSGAVRGQLAVNIDFIIYLFFILIFL